MAAFAAQGFAQDSLILQGLVKDQSGVLAKFTQGDYGIPSTRTVIIPTTVEATKYIDSLEIGVSYACKMDYGTNQSIGIFAPQITCVEESKSFTILNGDLSRHLDLVSIFNSIDSQVTVVKDFGSYGQTIVKEDNRNSCRAFKFKADGHIRVETCLINRFDPLTKIEHSCLAPSGCK
jgi:hypothetical protein